MISALSPAELANMLRWLEFTDSLLGRSSNDALIAFDRNCRYVYWSERMERLCGVSRAHALGRSAFEVFPFLLAIGEDAFYRRALAGESTVSRARALAAATFRRRARLVDTHYSPLKDSGGAIIGGAALLRDVSEKHAAEQQLNETERRFQTMADVAPVLLWMSRTDGMCTFFNQSWLDFTGRTLEQEWGVGWAEGVHFEDLQRCIDTYVDAFNAAGMFEMEYRLRRADGEFRWILDRGTPRYMQDGTFAGFIGSCIDITERKLIEAELRRALRAKDDFLAMVSHELRTPMTALELQIERFKREGLDTLTQQQADMLARMSRSTERLTALVDSVLQFARIERGRLRAEIKSFDLGALVQSAVEEIPAGGGAQGHRAALAGSARPAGARQRPRPRAPRAVEPAFECDEVHRPGLRRGHAQHRAQPASDRGARHRPRHSARGARARVRTVRAARAEPAQAHARRRARLGAGQGDDERARRRGRARIAPRSRQRVHDCSASQLSCARCAIARWIGERACESIVFSGSTPGPSDYCF